MKKKRNYTITLIQTYMQEYRVTFKVESDLTSEELENKITETVSEWRIARGSEDDLIRKGEINGYVKGSYSTWQGDYEADSSVSTSVEETDE